MQELTPTAQLQQPLQSLAGTVAERALSGVTDKVTGTADRLHDYAEGGSGDLLSAVTGVEKLAGGASPMKAAMSAGVSHLGHTVGDKLSEAKDSLLGGKGKIDKDGNLLAYHRTRSYSRGSADIGGSGRS